MYRFRSSAERLTRVPWLASAGLHGLIIALAVGLSVNTRPAERHTFITLEPLPSYHYHRMPAYGGTTRHARPHGGAVKTAAPAAAVLAPVVATPAAAPVARVDSTPNPSVAVVAAIAAAASSRSASEPKPNAASAAAVAAAAFPRSASDARIWVGPRPSLPKDVAEALYLPKTTDTLNRDTIVTRRLRAMVDSLNHVLDLAARDHKAPSWTTEVAGLKFGIDSANIYLAGIKIPTPVLALLSGALPQGNFDEAMRDRQMADIRRDMVQAAQRAQTMEEFSHYVVEIRARKQAERDAERRQRDSTHHTGPDTVRVVQ